MNMRFYAAVALLTLGGCREATQVTFDISTDVACDQVADDALGITVGLDGQTEQGEATARVTKTQFTECRADGTAAAVGTYTVYPPANTDPDTIISFKAVLAARPWVDLATDCTAAKNYAGCVVARRTLSYLKGRSLKVPVMLKAECVDTPCDARSSCTTATRCLSSRIDAAQCAVNGTCPDLQAPNEGTPIDNKESRVTVTPAVISASGADTVEVTVTLRDAFGNVVPRSDVEVQVTPTPATLGAWVGTAFTSTTPGVFTRTWRGGTMAGSVTFAGRVAQNALFSPAATLTVDANKIAYANNASIASLKTELTADGSDSATLVVSLADQYGNRITRGDFTVSLSASTGNLVGASMTFNPVTLQYEQLVIAPKQVGTGFMTVRIASITAGAGVVGVPDDKATIITLKPGPVSIERSTLTIPNKVVNTASLQQDVTLQLLDANGNPVSLDGLTATGSVSALTGTQHGAFAADAGFLPQGGGRYTAPLFAPASFTGCSATATCIDLVSVSVRHPSLPTGSAIVGKPQKVQYGINAQLGMPAGVLTMNQLTGAAGAGASTLTGTLQLKNAIGQNLGVGWPGLNVTAVTSFLANTSAVDNDDGTWSVTVFSPDVGATGTLTVQANGTTVTNGTATIGFFGDPDPSRSQLTLSATTLSGPGSVNAQLQLRDVNGVAINRASLALGDVRFSVTAPAATTAGVSFSATDGRYVQAITRAATPPIEFETVTVTAEIRVNGTWQTAGLPIVLTITPTNLAGVTIDCSNLATYAGTNVYVAGGTLTINSWFNGATPAQPGCSGPCSFRFNRLTVGPGGVVTHMPGTGTGSWGLEICVDGRVDVQSGGAIDANGKGPSSAAGAVYFDGTNTLPSPYSYGAHGATFGKRGDPNEPGSSGSSTARLGGGVIRVSAANLTNNGRITADGTAVGNTNAFGGAGGSINLSLADGGVFDGIGTFSARGGEGYSVFAAPGEGGRIALHGDATRLKLSSFNVKSGVNSSWEISSGTLFFETPLAEYRVVNGHLTLGTSENTSVVPFDERADWYVAPGRIAAFTKVTGAPFRAASMTVDALSANSRGIWVTDAPLELSALTLKSFAWVSHSPLTSAYLSQRPRVDLVVDGGITIEEGASIDVSGRGYPALNSAVNTTTECSGTGTRPASAAGDGFSCEQLLGARGGNHFAAGGSNNGFTWGSPGSPLTYGGAGTPSSFYRDNPKVGAGGGIVRLRAQSLTLNGSILANGENAQAITGSATGAGAGGSVDIGVTGALSSPLNTGVISANGGTQTFTPVTVGAVHGGASGLVRVASGTRTGTIVISSVGGAGAAGGADGGTTLPTISP